jgi:predicted nucleotidyltransferase component of viral defense system
MIGKQDILDRAAEWQLRPEVVEKDYVLGWLLAAIGRHPRASRDWVFKGGTCLKKCYFETYRFSEDLDYSLLPGAAYQEDELRTILGGVARDAADLSGIEFPTDQIGVKSRMDKLRRPTFQGRIAYRGPLQFPSWRRILFDLTQHEPVLDAPAAHAVFHPYPDGLPEGSRVQTYSLDELFAEKTRALLERTRPRDLYDVVYILENQGDALDLDHARELLAGKCQAKGIPTPSRAGIVQAIATAEELRSEWANMLAHQLPQLPPVDSMLERMETLLAWVDVAVPLPSAQLHGAPGAGGGTLEAPRGIQYWGTGVGLEVIRFAGTNRLLVEFMYHGKPRRAAPYSLRRASTGNLLLYAHEVGATTIQAFNTAEIRHVRATNIPFTARWRVEFTATGPL